MKWFKRMVIRWVREDWEQASVDHNEDEYNINRPIALRRGRTDTCSNTLDSEATLTFTVYNAIGGKVVEFRRYDRKNDRSDHTVYVIGKDEDFGEKISRISTLEVMK
jgi:hypothetical protein